MDYAPGCGGAFRFRHAPGLGGGGHKHLPAGCADAAHRLPIIRRRGAAAGDLQTIFGVVIVRLFDAHILPSDVELLRDEHRQHGLHALPNFWILGHERGNTVGRDADEGVWRERDRRRALRCLRQRFREGLGVIRQKHPASCECCDTQKRATFHH